MHRRSYEGMAYGRILGVRSTPETSVSKLQWPGWSHKHRPKCDENPRKEVLHSSHAWRKDLTRGLFCSNARDFLKCLCLWNRFLKINRKPNRSKKATAWCTKHLPHMSDDFYLLCGWKELSIIIVPYLVYTFLVLLGCGPKNRISFTCVLTELPFVEAFVRAIVWGEARAGCFPQWNGCAEVFRKACAIAIILVCNHILKESDLKPRFQTTFWKKGVWNLGFRPHFGRKGSET